MQTNKILIEKYESLLTEKKLEDSNRKEVIKKFIKFAADNLGIKELPKIFIDRDEEFGSKHKTFGHFRPHENKIILSISNRNLADILRTLGHEMVHCKQLEDNKINLVNPAESGKDGSDIENEANSKAAVLMREFGRNNPEIYE